MSSSTLANPTYKPIPHPTLGFTSFAQFYPFYLGEHSNRVCRRLHFTGSGLVLASTTYALLNDASLLLYVPLIGYGFAWVGHFFFGMWDTLRKALKLLDGALLTEKNRPATFKYPVWSLRGDFRMFWEVISGQRAF
ncbi:hypothetical protein HKX48_008601 [Thoreauomyces humboldtii]|nr:hypothetical protein HKX48_008601 [Thoreauomyces humboldtii]